MAVRSWYGMVWHGSKVMVWYCPARIKVMVCYGMAVRSWNGIEWQALRSWYGMAVRSWYGTACPALRSWYGMVWPGIKVRQSRVRNKGKVSIVQL